MLCGYLPFEDPNTDKLYKKIMNCEYTIPNYVASNGRNLIEKILNTNPEERYTIEQIRAHPWFKRNLELYHQKQSNKSCDNLRRGLDIFEQRAIDAMVEVKQAFMPGESFPSSGNEIRINTAIVLEMIEKYKLPINKKREEAAADGAKYESFSIEHTLKSLAHNKHNDSTTTYYLLHKRWMHEMLSDKNGQTSGHLTMASTTAHLQQSAASFQDTVGLRQASNGSMATTF